MPRSAETYLDRRAGLGLVALASITAVILVTIVTLFVNLNGHEERARESVREDAIWAAYQLHNESARLEMAIDDAMEGSIEVDELLTSYDVLYSRTSFLKEGQYAVKFAGDSEISVLSDRIHDAIMSLAPEFDTIAATRGATAGVLVSLAARAADIRSSGAELLIETNANVNGSRVAARDRAIATMVQLAGGVGALVVAFASIVVLMAFQLVANAKSRKALQKLTLQHEGAREAAEEGNRAKSAFLATMSHEIRTPLNGIIGMVDLLEGDETDDTKRRRLATVRQSGDILLEIINDILDFSRLESGGIDLEHVSYRLEDVVESVRTIVTDRAASKGLSITVDCPPACLSGDPARVRQVLMNLAGNAVKFTDAGSVSIVAVVEETREFVEVVVSDTGIGIPDEAKDRLFKEFSQVDSSINRRYGGSGLGLAICGRLVKSMGGEIGVTSRPGEGSAFWFRIPYVQGEAVPTTENATAYVAPIERHRVLVVEDNATNRDVARQMLERLGTEVDVALDGLMACDMAKAGRYDMVFMDMQMPIMDGLQATRCIRGAGNPVAIVGLTANAFVTDREACLDAGMDDFMTKPVNRAKLETMLRTWLRDGPTSITPSARPAREVGALLIDVAQKEALVEEIGPDLLSDIVSGFWSEADKQLVAIAGAIAEGDRGALDALLHTMKGAAQTIGYAAVAQAAESARDQNISHAGIGKLRDILEATRRAETVSRPSGIRDTVPPAA